MRRLLFGIVAILSSASTLASPAGARQQPPAPAAARIERTDTGFRLIVDEAPFLILGGQAHNSSGSDPAALESFWKGIDALGANTAEVPVYWELIEPEPGRFDFTLVDTILRGAREHRVRLVLLWFASWKNGEMHYTPAWVKRDAKTHRRVIGPGGDEREIVSPLSTATRDADARAFAALLAHLRDTDLARTVIMIQVENEAGLMGTDRDYSDESTRAFQGPVPEGLMRHLTARGRLLSPSLDRVWTAAGRRTSGTWSNVFGELAAEAFSAWHIARYVDTVAAAGKTAYRLPMFVNAWLIGPGDERPGRWPSGGPTHHVIDIWKASAPNIDLIAPDIYQPYVLREMSPYVRDDNPLFVPELALRPRYAAFAFPILASGLGVSPFGVDAATGGAGDASLTEYARSYRALRPMLPTIARLQGTGRLHAIVQDLDPAQVVHLGTRVSLVVNFPAPFNPEAAIGRGLVAELGPDELIVTGVNLSIVVRDRAAPLTDPHQWATRQPVVSIEEGTFEGERWVTRRRLNGDERWVRLGPEGGLLRVRLRLP